MSVKITRESKKKKTAKKRIRGNGEGNIRQRKDGLWEARYTVGYDSEGRQIQKSIYGKDRGEVAKKLTKVLSQINDGIYLEESKITVKQWLQVWFDEYKKPTVRPNTLTAYETAINLINPVLGHIRLKDLKAHHVQALYNDFAKKYCKNTVKLIHIVLHSALKQAVKNDILVKNVTKLVTFPKCKDEKEDEGTDKEARFLTKEEQQKFIKALKGERLEAAFLLGLFCGLRRGEILGLTWDDVDLDKKILYVKKSLTRAKIYNKDNKEDDKKKPKSAIKVGKTKTAKSKRNIPMLDIVVTALKKHKKRQQEEKIKIRDIYQDNNFVFCTGIGTSIDPSTFNKEFKRILKKAGLDNQGITIHSLRHTFATLGIKANIPLKVIQELLGHSQLAITADIYSHVLPEQKEEAIRKLGNALKL